MKWQQCGKEQADGHPCPGIRADQVIRSARYTRRWQACLAHLEPHHLDGVLAELSPGCEIDVRGTLINTGLLYRLLGALREDGVPVLRDANFSYAVFDGMADFGNAIFTGVTRFSGAEFHAHAKFERTQFKGEVAAFDGTRFQRSVFDHAHFNGEINFSGAEFRGRANFANVSSEGDLNFRNSRFLSDGASRAGIDLCGAFLNSPVDFDGVWCSDRDSCLNFSRTSFSGTSRLGALGVDCLLLDEATFETQVSIEALAAEVSCRQATFTGGCVLRLRYARVRLESALLPSASSLVGSEPGRDRALDSLLDLSPIESDNGQLAKRIRDSTAKPDGNAWMPTLSSVAGVDVSELTVSDVDLSRARFGGSYHLDQLSVEGRSRFAEPPVRHRQLGLVRAQRAWPPLWPTPCL